MLTLSRPVASFKANAMPAKFFQRFACKPAKPKLAKPSTQPNARMAELVDALD